MSLLHTKLPTHYIMSGEIQAQTGGKWLSQGHETFISIVSSIPTTSCTSQGNKGPSEPTSPWRRIRVTKTTGHQVSRKTLSPVGANVHSLRFHPSPSVLENPLVKLAGQSPHCPLWCPTCVASRLLPVCLPLPDVLTSSCPLVYSTNYLSSASEVFFKTILTLLVTLWPWIPLHLTAWLILCHFVCGQPSCVS